MLLGAGEGVDWAQKLTRPKHTFSGPEWPQKWGLEFNRLHLGRNFFGKFVAKFCQQNKLFCALFWYLALETQKYPKSKILDFPILERMKPEKRNDRFQKIMISGFLMQDIMKVYKISYFGDKIWQQICQKSFFLSVTCWTLNSFLRSFWTRKRMFRSC